MEYLYEYLVFLAEVATVVIALLIIISTIASLGARGQHGTSSGHLRVEKINDEIKDLRHAMEFAVLPGDAVKKQHKAEAKATTKEAKSKAKSENKRLVSKEAEASNGRVFFITFDGDVKASSVDQLRTEVSAVLTMATSQDEVVVSVESPGGMVHGYGLAASQLTRFRDKDIPLTVVVDKVAASGGYLMAAVANKIIAAPFALLGSIGVVAQVPNVHRLLKSNDVDVEIHTAGKHKRTLTMFGENTDEARQKFVEELEDVHDLFQEFVTSYRPQLDMDTVATGEAWYGKRALEINLVDELATSDEYLMNACESHDVFLVQWEDTKKPIDRVLDRFNGTLSQLENTIGKFTGGLS